MSKYYFNTKTFDEHIKDHPLDITSNPKDAEILVLGAKKVDYTRFNNIKAIYRFGVGSENIDFEYLKKALGFVVNWNVDCDDICCFKKSL